MPKPLLIILTLFIIAISYIVMLSITSRPSSNNISEKDIGKAIFKEIMTNLAKGSGKTSNKALLNDLNLTEKDLPSSYLNEIIIGLLYGAYREINGKYEQDIAFKIIDSMRSEFFKELIEVDKSTQLSKDEVDAFVLGRWKEYDDILHGPYDTGRAIFKFMSKYYWNIIGKENRSFVKVMIVTEFYTAHKKLIESKLKSL